MIPAYLQESTDRHELADAYDDQRQYVMRGCVRGSSAHRAALRDLGDLTTLLHAAERAEGVPIGSTREDRS